DPAGFLELTVDGQPHSSDPGSAAFDPRLAGATRATLTHLRFDAPDGDATLTLGAQQLAGGLEVSAPAAQVVAGDLTPAGVLEVAAGSVTVRGSLRGSSVTLNGSGLVNVEAAGSLVAADGGRVEVVAGTFVNTGRVQAAGAGGQVHVHAGKVLDAGRL